MSALSKNAIATETYHLFLDYFSLGELAAIRQVSKTFDEATISLLARRLGMLCSRFLTSPWTSEALCGLLQGTESVITSSAAIWFACPDYTCLPKHLNIVSPSSYRRGRSLSEFFVRMGYVLVVLVQRLHSRSPTIDSWTELDATGRGIHDVKLLRPPPNLERGLTITITYLSASTVWPYIIASHSTHEMTILSATSFIALYPDTVHLEGTCWVRTFGSLTETGEIEESKADARSIGLRVDTGADSSGEECVSCPGEVRQLHGGYGSAMMVWKPASTHALEDVYCDWVISRFAKHHPSKLGPWDLSWQFSKRCSHHTCPAYDGSHAPTRCPGYEMDGIEIIHSFKNLSEGDPLFDAHMDVGLDDDKLLGAYSLFCFRSWLT